MCDDVSVFNSSAPDEHLFIQKIWTIRLFSTVFRNTVRIYGRLDTRHLEINIVK